MNDRVANALLVVLAVCAAAITGLVIRRELAQGSSAPRPAIVRDWRSYASAGQRVGEATAPVTAVVFSDYQCPFCRQAAEHLARIAAARPGELSVVYRHFPLTETHPAALAAALAAECGAEQGSFARVHDVLFARANALGTVPWDSVGREAGLPDVASFERCIAEERYRERVRADVEAGRQLGIRGTPLLLVNGRRVEGSPPLAELDSMVSAAARDGG